MSAGSIRDLYAGYTAALGDALIPYPERVDRAMKKILAKQAWTAPRGFDRLNKLFNGQLETILAEIGDRLWQEVV